MFVSMFALMFGLMTFAQAFQHIADAPAALENARRMFLMIETPSKNDIMAIEQESKKRITASSPFNGKITFKDVWFRYPERKG